MSGRKQHHIPQLLLRAFAIPSKGKVKRVWQFSRERTGVNSTKDVAAERDFYSDTQPDAAQNLDRLLTLYENKLASYLASLRATPIDTLADAVIAAEAVSHLTIRNAHLRQSFSGGLRLLASRAIELFSDETRVRALFGLDGTQFSPFMAERLDELMTGEPQIGSLGLPRSLLHKIAFVAMKENFGRFIANDLPSMRLALELFSLEAPEQMRAGHNQSLAGNLVPDQRMAILQSLHWTVRSVKDAILPDSVALGIEGGDLPRPLIMCGLEHVSHVLMPLAPNLLLLGSRSAAVLPDLSEFNVHAAACCHSFFVSHRNGLDLQGLVPVLGTRSSATIEQAITAAFEGFKVERQLTRTSELTNAPDQVEPALTNIKPAPDLSYSASFYGIADKEMAERISSALFAIVTELQPVMPLDRLDGFTFAQDYDTALRNLHRGFETHTPLAPTFEDYGVGVAMTAIVLRDGIVKSHVVARMDIAAALLDEDETGQRHAMHVVIRQLAHVACNQMLDESLPGFFLSEVSDNYDAFLYPCIDGAWGGYFSARASAIFDPTFGQAYRDLAVAAFRRARVDISAARLQYRFHGKLDQLLAVVRPRLRAVLTHIAHLLGHYDGLDQPTFLEPELEQAIEDAGLRGWIDLFQADLAAMWEKRARWRSPSEFIALTNHAERLFWPFGLFPWKTPEGLVRVEIPIASDAALLASAAQPA